MGEVRHPRLRQLPPQNIQLIPMSNNCSHGHHVMMQNKALEHLKPNILSGNFNSEGEER